MLGQMKKYRWTRENGRLLIKIKIGELLALAALVSTISLTVFKKWVATNRI